MEDVYSVSTNNRFALFMDDEDDPGDAIVSPTKLPDKSEKKPETKKVEKAGKAKPKDGRERPQAVQNGKKPVAESTNKRAPREPGNERSPAKERSQRPERSGPRENRPPRNNSTSGEKGGDNRPPRQNRNNNRGRLPSRENDAQGSSAVFDDSGEGRGPRGDRPRQFRAGRGGGRLGSGSGGPGSGGGGFRGKREFERRSGSDKSSVKPQDKREGGGAHNWGSVKDEVETAADELQGTQNEQLPNGETTEEKPKSGDEKEEEEEEAVSELTLDEFYAQQEKKRYRHEFNERKAGENEDQGQWKGAVRYERAEDEFFPGTREEVVKYKTSGRVRTQLQGNFFFKDPVRRGGGRAGGRGRGNYDDRRRPGRNRDRNGLNVEDEKEFPSLAAVSA